MKSKTTKIMLIWDFDVDDVLLSLTASQCSVKAKIPSKLTSIAFMPYLDPKSVNCNCASMSARQSLRFCPMQRPLSSSFVVKSTASGFKGISQAWLF